MDCSPPGSSVWGFPGGSAGKESACNAGDLGSIPGLGSPVGGKGYPLQDSDLENPTDCLVPGVSKSQAGLSGFHFHFSGSSVRGNSPGKNTGVGGHALLQGIFLTQGSNPGFLHCRWLLYQLSFQGSPSISVYVSVPISISVSLSIYISVSFMSVYLYLCV